MLDRLADKFLVGDGCWQWTGALTSHGYGNFWLNGRMQRAHRVMYGLVNGPIQGGLGLDHLCRNRACVRPDHLEPVTQAENVRRGTSGAVNGARMRAKTHCPDGHLYGGGNLFVRPNGYRECRTCQRASSNAWKARRRASQ